MASQDDEDDARARRRAGLRATNREFLRYDQVEKRQTYALAEGGAREEFDEETLIRTIDLDRLRRGDARERRAFADELGEALRDIGFAVLVNTGIDPTSYERTERAVARLFAHDLATKLRFRAQRHGSVNQGYFPLEETSDIHPDLVEGWVFCRRAFELGDGAPLRLEDFWPEPAEERVFRAHVLAHEPLILPLMRSVLEYLGCDSGSFDARLTRPSFGLRLNWYPPIDPARHPEGAGRLLGHEDVDLFTLLPAPRSEGLQVLNRKSSRWIRLDPPAGSLVLNTGDYMQRITNDILPSTTHRVSAPRDAGLRGCGRVSFPLNVYLWEEEWLEVLPGLPEPRYGPVRAVVFHTRATAKYYGDGYAAE